MDISLDAPLEQEIRAFELWKEVSQLSSELKLDFVKGIWFNLLDPHSPLYPIYEHFFEGLFSLVIQVTQIDQPAYIEYRSPAGVFYGQLKFSSPEIEGPLVTSKELTSFFSVHPRWEKKGSLMRLSLDQNDALQEDEEIICFGFVDSGRVAAFKEGSSELLILDEKGQKKITIEHFFEEVLGL